MLVVCNGAQKSGSTWLYNILTSLVDCQEPDDRFLTGNSRNPCIRPDMLEDFLDSVDYRSSHFVTKNHLDRPVYRDILMSKPDVFVFDIERDPKDVAVSVYYDACNRDGYSHSFRRFYWSHGREQIAELATYHSLWRNAGPRSHVARYEGLKTEFATEARAIASVLDIQLSDDDVDALLRETSMDALRKKYSGQKLYQGDRFFRKGVVGDWKNHFDSASLRDIDRIVASGVGRLDWRHVLYQLRRRIEWRFGK